MHLAEHFELACLYCSKPREELGLAFLKLCFGNLLRLKQQLKLEQLLFDDGLIVELLIDDLLYLVEYESEAAYGSEQ